jgi:hypothetical protein
MRPTARVLLQRFNVLVLAFGRAEQAGPETRS